MKRLPFRFLGSIFLAAFLTSAAASAAFRDSLSLQGVLYNNDESPVDGLLIVTFRMYDSQESTAALWEEVQTLDFQGGVYSVSLGSVTPIPAQVYDSENLFIGIQIESDSEMSPRIGLFSVPWAQQAEVATTALSLDDNAQQALIAAVQEAGVAGPQGPAGPTGPQGPQGPPGVDISGGDITGVAAGTGLTGGGDSGEVSLSAVLGTSVGSPEVEDGTLVDADISAFAAILGTKVSPDFGAQDLTTTGDIEASGGFKTMIGPFQETDVSATETKNWEMPIGTDEVPVPWAGSMMGVSVKCKPGSGVTAGTLTVEPTINGTATDLEVTLTSSSGSNKHGQASQAKDADPFAAGDLIGCKATSASLSPTTLDCVCLVFVEM